MKPWIADELARHSYSLDLREDYGGRGMDGKTTHAVVGTTQSILVAAASAARDLEDESRMEEFMDALESLRIDAMGTEKVFY